MHYIIVDLEATCWETGTSPERMEIIEIGAVHLPSDNALPDSEYARFVRPATEPVLSDFCKQLTSISQTDVDQASPFAVVFPEFLTWIGSDSFTLCSWGAYDLRQFRIDCQRVHIPFPSSFEQHINLKAEFARLRGIKPCGMKAALSILKLPLEGTHHRGIDDARNITKIARVILPELQNNSLPPL